MLIVESIVPTPAMPNVPTTRGISANGAVGASSAPERKKNMNSGTATTSTSRMNRKFDVAFTRKMAERSRGASRSPSMHASSFS